VKLWIISVKINYVAISIMRQSLCSQIMSTLYVCIMYDVQYSSGNRSAGERKQIGENQRYQTRLNERN
jgi:hypothetical protein